MSTDTPNHDPTGGYDSYSFVAEFYDHVFAYADRDDVDFFTSLAKETGGPVLEIGCGTGRVVLPMARVGIEIVGLDLSEQMLAICRRHLADEREDVRRRVQLVRADMRDFDLGRRFPLITMPFRPFQHLLTIEDQLACLATVRRHLSPGGRFVLDLFNPSLEFLTDESKAEESTDEAEFEMPDGRKVVRSFRLPNRNRFEQVNDVEIIYNVTHPDGRTERLVHGFPMRYLFRFEAEHLLARAGFTVENLYSGYDRQPFGSRYPGELIFVCSVDEH